MVNLDTLAREGAVNVLHRLCTGPAKFKDLSEIVHNPRTLSRRLKELQAHGLIGKTETGYRITGLGLEVALNMAELEASISRSPINTQELSKVRYGWMRISLNRLVELLLDEFGERLITVALYGSVVKDSFQLGRSDVDMLYIVADEAKSTWEVGDRLFRAFKSTWEYRACDYWLRIEGSYGYPEVTTARLLKSYAVRFQPVYLDMLFHRAILYDAGGFLEKLMEKLLDGLKRLGTIRIEHADGTHGWFLKPDIASGELIAIDLG